MPPAIRVELTPLESSFGRPGQTIADGAAVSLTALGPFSTKLPLDEAQPAKLSFEARFVERLRGDSVEETRPLATLEGKLTLGVAGSLPSLVFEPALDAEGNAVGLVPAEPIDEDEEEPEDAEDPMQVRVLRFAFDSAQFPDFEAETGTHQLLFKLDPARFSALEVSARLEVAGADEAVATANDALDVLITERNPGRRRIVVLRLTDEAGEVIPGAQCQIVSGATPAAKGADPKALTANGEGEVRLKTDPGATLCEVAWGPDDGQPPRFKRKLFLELGDDPDEALSRRLNNLGYTAPTVEENVLAFQGDFQRPPTGRLADIAGELREFHDNGVRPEPGEPSEPSSEPVAVTDVPRNSDFDDLFEASGDSGKVAVA